MLWSERREEIEEARKKKKEARNRMNVMRQRLETMKPTTNKQCNGATDYEESDAGLGEWAS